MKLYQFRQLIREEVRKVINEAPDSKSPGEKENIKLSNAINKYVGSYYPYVVSAAYENAKISNLQDKYLIDNKPLTAAQWSKLNDVLKDVLAQLKSGKTYKELMSFYKNKNFKVNSNANKLLPKIYDKIYSRGDDALDALDTAAEEEGLTAIYDKYTKNKTLTSTEATRLLNLFNDTLSQIEFDSED